MPSFVSVAVVGLALVACSTTVSAPSVADVPMVRLRSEPYSFAYNTGLVQPARLVVRDTETWRSTWNKIYEGHSPVPPLPEIDFSKEAIIVAALGQRGSGGYSIIFDSASPNAAGGLDVVVRSISPGSNCGTTAALTQPADVARIPSGYASVRFIEKAEVMNCGSA